MERIPVSVRSLLSEIEMPKFKWLVMVVAANGRYEKTIELPFAPQVGMTIFRGGSQLMWSGECPDRGDAAPPITRFGYNLDEERFEVEILIAHEVKLASTFWDDFIPL
jgi:hypothetical protein